MRCNSSLILLGLLLGGAAGFPAAGAEGVDWKEDYRALVRAAEEQDKLIVIEFYTSWCQYCRKLEREAFGDERVAELLREDFVVAKLDAEIQKAAARRYRPDGYPTVVFATPAGDEILRFSGYRTPDQVYEIIKTVRDVGPRVARLLQRVDAERKSFDAHRNLGALYAGLGVGGKACHHLERARRYAPDERTEAEIRFLQAKARLTSGECSEAERILEDLLEDHGEENAPEEWRTALAEARDACAGES